eukprot:m51a1_g264 hypothetical protein (655) ;mRNA; f:232672-234812
MAFLTAFDEDALFRMADADGDGVVGASDAAFFTRTMLPKDTLKLARRFRFHTPPTPSTPHAKSNSIWDAAVTNRGQAVLRRENFRHALLLVSLAQSRRSLSTNLSTCGPLPAPVLYSSGVPQPLPGAVPSAAGTARSLAPLTPQERATYDAVYEANADTPRGVSGERARVVLGSYGLPVETLSRVWAAADMDVDGVLSRREWALALALIAHCRAGGDCPPSVPPAVLASLPTAARPNYNVRVDAAEGSPAAAVRPSGSASASPPAVDPIFGAPAWGPSADDLFRPSAVDWGSSASPQPQQQPQQQPQAQAQAQPQQQQQGASQSPFGGDSFADWGPKQLQPSLSPQAQQQQQPAFMAASSLSPRMQQPQQPAFMAASSLSPRLQQQQQQPAFLAASSLSPRSSHRAQQPQGAAAATTDAVIERQLAEARAMMEAAAIEQRNQELAAAAAAEALAAQQRLLQEERARAAEAEARVAALQAQVREAQEATEAARQQAAQAADDRALLDARAEDAAQQLAHATEERQAAEAAAAAAAAETQEKQRELEEAQRRAAEAEEAARAEQKRAEEERGRVEEVAEAIAEAARRAAEAEEARRKASVPPEWLEAWEPAPGSLFGKDYAGPGKQFADPKADPFASDDTGAGALFPLPLDQFSSA